MPALRYLKKVNSKQLSALVNQAAMSVKRSVKEELIQGYVEADPEWISGSGTSDSSDDAEDGTTNDKKNDFVYILKPSETISVESSNPDPLIEGRKDTSELESDNEEQSETSTPICDIDFGEHLHIRSDKGNGSSGKTLSYNEKSYTCVMCNNKHFCSLSALRRHKLTHAEKKPHVCIICGKEFALKTYLILHARRHTGEKPYKCKICCKQFSQNSSLNTHILIHTGERPYKCKICGRQFSRSSALIRHTRSHTGEKSHSCDICGKQFLEKPSLKRHIRMHTKEKPYPCPLCSKPFASTAELSRHSVIHTRDKRYQCKVCKDSFPSRSYLYHHNQTHIEKVHTTKTGAEGSMRGTKTLGSNFITMIPAATSSGNKVVTPIPPTTNTHRGWKPKTTSSVNG